MAIPSHSEQVRGRAQARPTILRPNCFVVDEGQTAPGARVTYCECPLAAAAPDSPHGD